MARSGQYYLMSEIVVFVGVGIFYFTTNDLRQFEKLVLIAVRLGPCIDDVVSSRKLSVGVSSNGFLKGLNS